MHGAACAGRLVHAMDSVKADGRKVRAVKGKGKKA